MTPEQVARADAFNSIPQTVLDDLIVYSRNLPADLKAGGADVVLYIYSQRSAQRREAVRGPRTVKKGKDG